MKRFAIITGILAGMLFGVATPFSKLLLSGMNSFQLAGLLYLGAAAAMLPFILRKNSDLKLLFLPASRLKTTGIIFFGGFLGPVLLLAGLKTANAASVSIWLNMELVATAILGMIIFRDWLDRYSWIALLLTVSAGVITVIGEGVSGWISGLLITAACFSWAIDNHLTALTDGAMPQAVTFIKGLVAGSVNFILGNILAAESLHFTGISLALLVGIFSYGISISLYVTSAQNIGATRSQILFSTAPLWGVLLSYIFFKGTFEWVHVLALLLLVVAVIVTNVLSHSHTHTHVAMEHIHYHRHDDEHHDHLHDEENKSPKKWHSHQHRHDPLTHEHPHDPDLHHRHGHGT